MKKSILLLFGLGVLLTSCSEDKNDPSTKNTKENTTLEKVVEEFKFLGDEAKVENVSEKAMEDLKEWIAEYNAIDGDKIAKKGQGGRLGKRYVNAQGVETIQLIKKGLIGALQLNGFNKYGRTDLNKAVKFILGDYNPAKPKTLNDFKAEGNAFGKYMMVVAKSTKFKDIDKKIYKAIEDKNSLELVKLVNTVVAVRGVHYMSKYADKIRSNFDGESVHELSEGLGFAYSLQFAYTGSHQPPFFYLTSEQAKKFADVNLWDEAKDKSGNSFLDKQSKKIAEMFGFTVADAK